MADFNESLLEPAFDESLLVPETRPERGQRLRAELAAVRQEPAALSDPNASAPAPVTTFQSANETMLMPPGEEYRQFQLPRAGAPGISPITTFQGPSETTLLPNEDARRVGEVLQNTAASGIEGIVNPMTPPFILGTMAAPEIAIPLLTATMGKSGSVKLAEGIVDLEQGREKEGVAKLGEAGSELGLAALPALHPSAFVGEPTAGSFAERAGQSFGRFAGQGLAPFTPPVELPLSMRAAAEAPLQPFMPARVQPGERAGIPIPTLGEAMTRPGLPTQPKGSPVEVPGTAPEARETVIETIRNADARTLAQIQALFPEAKLSREQARVFRNIAFPPVPEPVRPQATATEVLGRPPGTLPPPTLDEQAAIQEQLRTEQPGIATVEPPAPAAETAPEPAPAPAEAPQPAALTPEAPAASPEAPKPAPAKEPWQMTQAEVVARNKRIIEGNEQVFTANAEHAARTNHREIVRDAIAEGRAVPAEVLADYPDLKPAPAPVAEPAATPAAPEPAAPVERTIPLINLRESEATPMALGKIKARDPQRWQDIVKYFKVGDTPGTIAKIAQEKIAEIKARTVPEPPKADVGKPEEPPPPQTTQYGMMMPGVEMLLGEMPGKTVSPTSEPFWNTERSFSQNISGVASWIRDLWRGFAMKQAPKITDSNRAAGESGVRYAAAPLVARAKGLEFAATVLRDTGVEPKKFGTALSEDNLRDIKDRWGEAAAKAIAEGDVEGAALAQDKSDAVRTLIGANRSPFKTEAEYQAFLNDPAVKTAIARHIQLWQEQKDPLFRQANDLDPDVPLAGRGKQTGARINLKALAPDEKGVAVVGGRPAKLRQLATKLRRDPFARRATGGGQAYEGDYNELMAHGFGTEYPIAAQHEFIKALIEAGDAKVTDKEFPEGMTIKGEKPVANILRLNPWRGKFLQVRRSLVDEYRAISNLDELWKIPILTPFNDLMTKQSIQGFAEGSTHTSNLMMEIFTGLGPTNNPLLNSLIKSVGRADLLYSVPRVIIKAFQDTKPEMLRLAEAGMAKEPYQGKMLGRVLNGADRGVRLVSEQIYDGMAKKGWVENTETGKREFINQIGNYNKRLQPSLIRKLRDTGIQPFATAMQTFNVMGLRRLVGAPGAKATSNMAALALRADIAGGFIGFVALTTYLNYLLSGNAAGPKGTPLGAVGWKDEHGKTHFFNVGRLLGYERGARITGLGPYMEARRNGLTHEQALQAGGRSVASTVMSYPAGPGPRALYTVGTGMRMNQPTVREAPAVPPTESLNPFKTQLAKNIQTAVIEANPAISSLHDLREGKSVSDIAEKQFGRYTPREGKSEGFYRALPKIVTKGQLIDYADDVVKEARKLPISQRMNYIQTRFNKDDLKAQYRNDVMTEIKRKGVLRYQ